MQRKAGSPASKFLEVIPHTFHQRRWLSNENGSCPLFFFLITCSLLSSKVSHYLPQCSVNYCLEISSQINLCSLLERTNNCFLVTKLRHSVETVTQKYVHYTVFELTTSVTSDVQHPSANFSLIQKTSHTMQKLKLGLEFHLEFLHWIQSLPTILSGHLMLFHTAIT